MAIYKPSAILLGVSIFLLVAGVVIYVCIPSIFYALLSKELPFSNDSLTFKIWRDIPLPIYQHIYLFNITNADEFLKNGAKPNFVEVGPYTYSSKWSKKIVSWNKNGTIAFRETKIYQFERNLSVGSDDDVISSINGPMVVAATLTENSSFWMKIALNFLFWLAKEKLFIKKTVKELTYSGYNDSIIAYAPLFYPNLPYRDGKFAWLYKKNDSNDGLYNVFTGQGDLGKFNVIDRFKGERNLPFWKGNYCGMFNGSNGEASPPLFHSRQITHVFQSDLCRSWPLKYHEPSEILNIPSIRYIADEKILQNGTDNPENACYNVGKNLPSGTLDISPCQYGAPAILSYPHFYLADKSYLNAVTGLHPNSSRHSFYIDIEPNSGFSVNAAVRVQLNLYLHNIKGIWPFHNLSPTPLVFPILWQEMSFYLTDELAEEFDKMVIKPQLYAKISTFVVIGISSLLAIAALLSFIILHRKQKLKDDDDVAPLNINDDDSLYGQTNEIMKENGRMDGRNDDDEPAIRDV